MKKERPLDQLYRYPTDVQGKPWEGIVGHEATPFLKRLDAIKDDFLRLEKVIFS
jgi:hypothetical protein